MHFTVDVRGRTWTYVDVRGRTWTYVDVRPRTSTYVDVRGRTSTYIDVRGRTSTYVDEIFGFDFVAACKVNDSSENKNLSRWSYPDAAAGATTAASAM